MRIRKNDKVLVLAGKDRGKTGMVIQTLPTEDKVVVDKVNKVYKHVRPRKAGEKGQRIELFGPVQSSNVMIICGKCSKATRVGVKILSNGKKERVCKKCGEIL